MGSGGVSDIIVDHLHRLVKRNFDRDKADNLLRNTMGLPRWLTDLMDDTQGKQLLVDLFKEKRDQRGSENSDSLLLRLCIKKLFDRNASDPVLADIAATIDLFSVFQSL